MLEILRMGWSSEGGPVCPPSDKVRSEVGEAGDCRRNESRDHSALFTYDLQGDSERCVSERWMREDAKPARMDVWTYCIHSP